MDFQACLQGQKISSRPPQTWFTRNQAGRVSKIGLAARNQRRNATRRLIDSRLLSPTLSSFEEERENNFEEHLPGVVARVARSTPG